MRQYRWLIAATLLIGAALAVLFSRSEGEPEPVVLPPLPVAAPRVVKDWVPAPGLEVELVVSVTEQGRAVNGAEVRANGKGALTDQNGLATFRLPPGPVQLSASALGARVIGATTLSPLLGSVRFEFSLDERGAIEVTVTDATTQLPLPGALVELQFACVEPARVLATAQSDAQGKVKIEGLSPAEYRFAVSHPGYARQFDRWVSIGRPQAIQLQPRVPLSGRVLLADGKPAAGATVISLPYTAEETASAITAADGTFTLPFANRDNELCAQLGALVGSGSIELATTTGLVVAEASSFEGTVVDEDGAPLEGVQVRSEDGVLEVVAFTGRDGRFTISGLCSPTILFATFSREGFVSQAAQFVDDEEDQEPLQVVLTRPRAVRGVVVDDENQPVPGALVSLLNPSRTTVADARGQFGFDGVTGEVSLTATEAQRRGSVQTTIERGRLVEVTISVGPQLHDVPVEVVMDGKPAAGLWDLHARRLDGRAWETTSKWYASGRVLRHSYPTSLLLPVGSFKVTAKEEFAHGEAELRVTGTSPQAPLRIYGIADPLPPPEPTRPLRVRVLDANGSPVGDAGVECSGGYSTRTDSSGAGAIAVPETAALPTLVWARAGGRKAEAHPEDWNKEVLLQLNRSMNVRGNVVGELRESAILSVNSKEAQQSVPFSPPHFELPDLPAVRTILCVSSENSERGCAIVTDPIEGGELEVAIPIGPPAQLTFSVSDARGQSVAEPVLYVDRHTARPPIDGGVVTLGLSPGQHLLIVNVNGGPERYETILTVEAGKAQHLGRIELK